MRTYACTRCVDEMAAMLQRAGFRDVLVDWGGDVKVLDLVRVRVRVKGQG